MRIKHLQGVATWILMAGGVKRGSDIDESLGLSRMDDGDGGMVGKHWKESKENSQKED